MATKRNRADSAASAVKAMVNAAKDAIQVPAHVKLRDGDMVFWEGVVRARARDEWTETDLVVAGQLARCLHDIEDEQAALDEEGTVIRNDKGTPVVNPRVSVLEQFARREMALMRTLRMGGRVAGAARDEAPGRKIERQSREIRKELEDDELLA
ncbi:MAG: TerS protein [Desulfuromonadaceae bacterium]